MPPIGPGELSDEQRPLDEHVRQIMSGLRTPFTVTDERGALIGPCAGGRHSFGESGTAEPVFLIAQYAGVSVVLNAYDVPLPPDAG
ncbi:hypothetical protein [Nonomuraea sp. NPDC050643]|uniref:hypothetical protein n=1 Tax=Nonomuraea sp. NPDC050643 TaxID=3155660 RepID=UPI0033D7BC0D